MRIQLIRIKPLPLSLVMTVTAVLLTSSPYNTAVGKPMVGEGLTAVTAPKSPLPPLAAPETPPAPVVNPNPAEDTVSTRVGATSGQFSVDEAGAANYSIPILAAPSALNLKPSLALSYNSQAGNGIAGVGWSISGLSTISRCGQSLESGDSINRGVLITNQDRFCLDGQRLLLVSGASYGADGAEYRTEIDGISRIKSVGVAGTGPAYFKVWRKDGTVIWYGAQSDSTAANPARMQTKRFNDSTAYAWLIGRTMDSSANHIDYDWRDIDPATAKVETVLDQIRFGGNQRSGFTALATNNVISFTYEARPLTEQTVGYLANMEIRTTQRLKTITSSADNLELRRYNLTYRSDGDGLGRSALSTVQECNGTLCYPATTFNWRRGTLALSALSATTPSDGSLTNAANFRGGLPIDLNGDGLQDYLYMERDASGAARPWLKWWLSTRSSTGVIGLVNGGSIQMATGIRSDASKLPRLQIVDINGDGYNDVIYGNKASGATTGYFYGHLWLGTGLGAATTVGSTPRNIYTMQVMDWNGDGLGDLLFSEGTGSIYGFDESIRVAVNQGHSSPLSSRFVESVGMSIVVNSAHFPNYGTSLFLTPFINTTLDERIFDADGDGAVDIVLRLTQEFCDFNCPPELAPIPAPANDVRFVTTPVDDNAAPEPAPSGIIGGTYQTADRYITFRIVQNSPTQVNLVSTAVVALGSTDDLGGAPSKVDNLKLVDINGDGLGDAFYYSLNTNQWAYRLSSGTAFKSEVKLATTLGLPTDSAIRKQLRLYDVNGDGYPDMLFPSAMGSDTALWKVSYWSWNSGGTYLAAVNTTTQTGHINNGAVTEFGDFNADSKLDAMQLKPVSGAYQIRRALGRNALTASTTYEPVAMVDQFTNGFGYWNQVIYRALSQRSVYTRDRTGPYSGYGRGSAVYDLVPNHYVVAEARSLMPSYALNATATASTFYPTSYRSVQYYYTGARVQGGGRGYLGFREVAAFDGYDRILTRTRYRQNFPYIGAAEESHRWFLTAAQNPWAYDDGSAALTPCATCANTAINTAGVLQWRSLNTWSQQTTSGGAQFTYPSLSQEWHYAPNFDAGGQIVSSSLVIRRDSSNTLNSNGDATLVRLDHYTASNSLVQRQQTQTSYNDDYTNWFIGRPQSVVVQSDRRAGACTEAQFNGGTDSLCNRRTTNFAYDAATGLMNSETRQPGDAALQVVISYTLDRFGNQLNTTVAPALMPSSVSSVLYDARGRYVTRRSNAYGQYVEQAASFTRFGDPQSITDLAGMVTQIKYDAMGREYFRYSPTGAWGKQVLRTGSGAGICPTDAAYYREVTAGGAPSNWLCFDKLGREIRRQENGFDGVRRGVDTHYEITGEVAEVSEPFVSGSSTLYWTRTQYDELTRPLFIRAPDGSASQINYSGLTVSHSNALGQTRTETRNVLEETLTVTDHLGGVISYTYDANGNVLTVDGALTTADGVSANTADRVTMSYDRLGRKLTLSDPDMGNWQYRYDALGHLLCQQDAKGQLTTYSYDLMGRELNRKHYASGTLSSCTGGGAVLATATQTYSNSTGAGGNRGLTTAESFTHDGFTINRGFNYDSFGRLDVLSTTMDGRTWAEDTNYDEYGRIFQQFDAAGSELGQALGVRYVYTASGHLSQLREAEGGATGRVYIDYLAQDARGQITQTRYANNLVTNRSYDPASGRLTALTTGTNVQSLTYQWNALGNLISRQDQSQGHNQKEVFAYDGLNRLLTTHFTAPALGINNVETLRMRYDAAGNIRCKSDVSAVNCTTGSNYTYPASGRVHAVSAVAGVTYSYDANGNLTGDSSGRSITYAPFERARVIASGANSSSYFYDAELNWVKRVTQGSDALSATGETLWRVGNVEISERNGVRELRRLIGGEVQISHWSGATAQEKYFHQDHLGSIDSVTNATGQVIGSLSHAAFGARRSNLDWRNALTQTQLDAARAMTSEGYTDHEMVDSSAIVHMGGRLYDPRSGRFLQADPNIQAPDNSQNLNRYTYVLNNPLSYTDPSGFFFKKLFKAVGKFFKSTFFRVLVAGVLSYFTFGAVAGLVAGMFSTTAAATLGATIITNMIAGAAAGFVGSGILTGSISGALKGAFFGAIAFGLGSYLNSTGLPGWAARGLSGGINGAIEKGDFGGFFRGFIAGQLAADLGIKKFFGSSIYYTKQFANFVINRARDYLRGYIIDGRKGAMKNLIGGLANEAVGHAVGITTSSLENGRLTGPTFREGFYHYSSDTLLPKMGAGAITFGNVITGPTSLLTAPSGNLLLQHERAHFLLQSGLGPYYIPVHMVSQWVFGGLGMRSFMEYKPFITPDYNDLSAAAGGSP